MSTDLSDRTQGKAASSLEHPRIEIGRILNIYPERGTVDFRSEMSEQYRYDIPYCMPYFDQTEGSGIYANPEVGTTALCLTTSEGRSFIMAYIGVDEEGSYLGGRPTGVPGDVSVTGRDGNFMVIRRGGIVQIGSKPICQSVYLPTRNIIQQFCENFELHSIAGDMYFTVDRPEDSSEGHSKVRYSLNIREYADDKTSIADLVIGNQPDNLVLSLITKNKGDGDTKIKITLDKEGTLNVSLEKNLKINIKGDTSITTTGKTEIISSDDIKIDSKKAVNIHVLSFSMKADQGGEVASTGLLTLKGATVRITDNGTFPVLRMSPDMAAFIGACAAMAKVPPPSQAVNAKVLV